MLFLFKSSLARSQRFRVMNSGDVVQIDNIPEDISEFLSEYEHGSELLISYDDSLKERVQEGLAISLSCPLEQEFNHDNDILMPAIIFQAHVALSENIIPSMSTHVTVENVTKRKHSPQSFRKALDQTHSGVLINSNKRLRIFEPDQRALKFISFPKVLCSLIGSTNVLGIKKFIRQQVSDGVNIAFTTVVGTASTAGYNAMIGYLMTLIDSYPDLTATSLKVRLQHLDHDIAAITYTMRTSGTRVTDKHFDKYFENLPQTLLSSYVSRVKY